MSQYAYIIVETNASSNQG